MRLIEWLAILMLGSSLAACGGSDTSMAAFFASSTSRPAAMERMANGTATVAGLPATIPAQEQARQLMNWAESNMASWFPGHPSEFAHGSLIVRYYAATNTYLGVVVASDPSYPIGHVLALGSITGGALYDAGPLTNFMTPVVPPLPAQATSQLNAKNLNVPAQVIPTFPRTEAWSEAATGGVAFADFLQEGKVSLLVATNRWSNDPAKPSYAGQLYFYQYVDGQPVDVTSRLLRDNAGCEAPRSILIADFNGDAKPDAFISCHGNEWGPVETWKGEPPRLLLSQPDGTYSNTAMPFVCFCHASTAGDINGDGKVDLVLSDMNAIYARQSSYFQLLNDGAGNFTRVGTDRGWMLADADYETYDRRYYKASFDMQLIDFDGDGKLDLYLGYAEVSSTSHSFILKGDGKGGFTTLLKSFPRGGPEVSLQSVDAAYIDGALYVYLNTVGKWPSGIGYEVRKYAADLSGYSIVAIAQIDNGYDDPVFLMPYNGTLVPYDARHGLVIPQ
jgi:hypothetical protein